MANEDKTQFTETDYTEEENGVPGAESIEGDETEAEDNSLYSQQEEYDDGYDADDNPQPAPPAGKGAAVIVFILILALIFAGIVWLVKHFRNGADSSSDAVPPPAAVQQADDNQDSFFGSPEDSASGSADGLSGVSFNEGENSSRQQDFAPDSSMDKNDAAADNEVSLEDFGENKQAGDADDSIMVAWNKSSRQNPFRPPVMERSNDDMFEQIGDAQFEIIEPPTKLVPDENLTKLLQTQISGILYDEESPSAIVNLAGVDQFVKVGDEISGYKIKSITNNKVEISYKNNTYVASVGELFTKGRLEDKPAVSNLSSKFAGRYKNENTEEQ